MSHPVRFPSLHKHPDWASYPSSVAGIPMNRLPLGPPPVELPPEFRPGNPLLRQLSLVSEVQQ